jgi:hypothetical protein
VSAVGIVAAFRVVLILLDAGWAVYLIWLPDEIVTASAVWSEALRLVPAHDLSVLGFLFLIGPVLAAGSAFLSATHVVGRVGWALAGLGMGVVGACWGLTAVSWLGAALELDGNGAGSAWIAFMLAVLHSVLAFARRRGRQNRRATDRPGG